ncbi:hypothetical protein IQ06DRAFT_341327 [Phaeosphaeriaceae sp. SRC1lsM3a]|nr:hypothetical protein IQ06DRAFT_341327 [Stagonospora sp. SRC1lsM3a]
MGIAPRVMALPSPTTIETDNGIDFLLNQQQQHTWNFKLYSTSLSTVIEQELTESANHTTAIRDNSYHSKDKSTTNSNLKPHHDYQQNAHHSPHHHGGDREAPARRCQFPLRHCLRALFYLVAFFPYWTIDAGTYILADPRVWRNVLLAVILGLIAFVLFMICGILAGYEPWELMDEEGIIG